MTETGDDRRHQDAQFPAVPPLSRPEGPLEDRGPRQDLATLAAVAAALTSLAYVLINAAYLEFYTSLGVSPEYVGLDRLALLARSAGLLFVSVIFVMSVLLLIWLVRVLRALSRDNWGGRARRWSYSRDPARELWWTVRWTVRWAVRLVIIPLAAVLVIVGSTVWAIVVAGDRAEDVEKGIPAEPIALGPLQLVSIDADPARLEWLDESTKPPPVLGDPWLLYLGQNDRLAVFVACGQTVVMPASSIAPVILTTKEVADRYRLTAEERAQECRAWMP